MSPYSPPQSSSEESENLSFVRSAFVFILSGIVTAGSILMIGPQILVIVPLALGLGCFFAMRRSFWSLVCFGYPLTFGLLSAWIGYKETSGYEQTAAFLVSIGIGLIGYALIATGLWKSLPIGKANETAVAARG